LNNINDTLLTDANTLATGQSTPASKYGAYFTALTVARGDLTNATVGVYYRRAFLTSTL
jgi:hypothetical protein